MSDTHDQHITDLEKQVAGLRVRLNRLEEIIKSKGLNDDTIPDEEDDVEDQYFYAQAVNVVEHEGFASPALLQRELKIDYPRASRLMNMLEEKGIIGPPDGAKPRKVILKN